jgi:ABC-type Fe3+ transport system permease subunit
MKNKIIILAAIPGVIAAVALVLSFRSPVSADSIIGYVSVLALVGMAALEYRINWKRLFGR